MRTRSKRSSSPRPLPADDSDLEFGRGKSRWPLFALAYRATSAAVRVAGRERTLRFLLDLAFIARRLAFEQADRLWAADSAYRLRAFSLLTVDALREWIPADGSVIDVGCGAGHGSRIAAAAGAATIVGIDYSPVAIDAARRTTSDRSITYVIGDVTRSLTEQLGGAHFDVALLLHIIEHVERPLAFLEEVRSIASRIVIEVPDVEADYLNVARRALGAPFYADADHVREYSAATLSSQLAAGGWRLTHIDRRHGVLLAVAEAE